MCQRVMCQKREFTVTVKFNDPKLKKEIFVRIDMKHSYFSNYLFADVVETVVVCQKLIHLFA